MSAVAEMPPRTVLAVPGSSRRFLSKAQASAADAVMVDLEDGVAAEEKQEARALVDGLVRAGDFGGRRVWLRVNAVPSGEFAADAGLVRRWGRPTPVVLPMATAEDVRTAAAALPGAALVPMVETPAGVEDSLEIAGHPAVAGMMFGELDFLAAMGSVGASQFAATGWAHARVVNAAASAGKWTLAGPFPGIGDGPGLAAEAARDAAAGFAGKLCVHPSQLEAVAEAFSPTEGERLWAAALVAELEGNPDLPGAFRFQGRMVDAPVIARARHIVRTTAERSTL